MAPEGWERKKLSDIGSVKTGPFGSLLHNRDYQEQGTPIITVEHLSENGIIHKGLPLVSDSDRERLNKYILNTGDIVFSRVGSVDRSSIITEKENGWLFSGRLLRIRLDPGKLFAPFVNYFFQQERIKHFIRSLAVGGTMPSLNTSILSNVKVSFPTLPEQQRIAQILSYWDKAIEVTENLIEAKTKLKKGLMQQLLTEKKRLPKCTNENWETVKLKEKVDQFIVPMRDKPKKFNGEIPWCRIEDLNGKYLCDSKSGQYVDRDIIKEMNLKINPTGTVLCSCSANLGICAITKAPLITNQTFIGLVPSKEIDTEYLYYMLTFRAHDIQRLSSGTTISYLSRNEFENFKISYPPLDEQRLIASILSTCDKEIEILNKKLEALKQQKKGLMQKLLTGKVRVKIDYEPLAQGSA